MEGCSRTPCSCAPPRNLGGEIELSGAEHPPVEVQKAPAARQKWLDSVMVKEIDLCTYGTPASSVSIRALAIRLRITHYRKWDHFRQYSVEPIRREF